MQKNSIDKSIRNDASSIPFEIQTGAFDGLSRIFDSENPASSLTKKGRPLSEAQQLALLLGELSIGFEFLAHTESNNKTSAERRVKRLESIACPSLVLLTSTLVYVRYLDCYFMPPARISALLI